MLHGRKNIRQSALVNLEVFVQKQDGRFPCVKVEYAKNHPSIGVGHPTTALDGEVEDASSDATVARSRNTILVPRARLARKDARIEWLALQTITVAICRVDELSSCPQSGRAGHCFACRLVDFIPVLKHAHGWGPLRWDRRRRVGNLFLVEYCGGCRWEPAGAEELVALDSLEEVDLFYRPRWVDLESCAENLLASHAECGNIAYGSIYGLCDQSRPGAGFDRGIWSFRERRDYLVVERYLCSRSEFSLSFPEAISSSDENISSTSSLRCHVSGRIGLSGCETQQSSECEEQHVRDGHYSRVRTAFDVRASDEG
jgi:hypothetical protein